MRFFRRTPETPPTDPWSARPDVDPFERTTVDLVRPYTMTGIERILTAIDAARYVQAAGIPGAIVECGVWRGGSMMAMARTLLNGGDQRDVYLYDTFAGMPPPTAHDVSHDGLAAAGLLDDPGIACVADLADVKANIARVQYPADRVHYVVGKVEETIPATIPDAIAILRLDTDWYESTKHELQHLFPRLSRGGVLIVDDYGHWRGARQAVDEYFATRPLFFQRIDYTGRVAVKP